MLLIVRVFGYEPLARRTEQLAGPVVARGNHRQSASECFEDDERTRIVKGWVHEEIGRIIAVFDIATRAEKVDTVANL